MNLSLLQETLIRAARRAVPRDEVPYAFEKRITARIRGLRIADDATLWARALWKAAVPCTTLMLLMAVVTVFSEAAPRTVETADLQTQLETTLMASVSLENDLTW